MVTRKENDLLGRIDERLKHVENSLAELKEVLAHNYVNRLEFKSSLRRIDFLENILFSLIGLIVISVIAALIKLVLLG